MREALPAGVITAFLHARSVTEEYGAENPEARQALDDAQKVSALPDDHWYCYEAGGVEDSRIRLLRRRDSYPYDIPVHSGQFALAKIMTASNRFTEGGVLAEFRLLTPNPGRDRQKPARVNGSGLCLLLSEHALREHVTVVDRSEANLLVNDSPDLALHPDDLISAIRRIMATDALSS